MRRHRIAALNNAMGCPYELSDFLSTFRADLYGFIIHVLTYLELVPATFTFILISGHYPLSSFY
jgi:hypothetical protein